MTIISVTSTDVGNPITWATLPGLRDQKSPVPRGLRNYNGTVAVAALGSGDETAVGITFSFPTNYVFLPRDISIVFISDDTTSEFSDEGSMRITNAQGNSFYPLHSDGQAQFGATTLAINLWRPLGGWRQWLRGSSDMVLLSVQDMSMDTSTAGDIRWNANFWIFDIEQVQNWEPNFQDMILPYTN